MGLGQSRKHALRLEPSFGLCVMMACAVAACLSCPTEAATADFSGGLDIFLSWSSETKPRVTAVSDDLCLLLCQQMAGINLTGGLASFKWGPGRNGSLCLSGVADPMPVLGYRLAVRRSEYERFAGLMETDSHRTLVGHRLNVQATPRLRVAVSETAVLSGDPSPFFYWPFPGLPLYALQRVVYQQDKRPGNDANVNLGLDFSLAFGETSKNASGCGCNAELYGEILIDDAQGYASRRSWVPDFIGGLVGLDIQGRISRWPVTLNVEYTRINNYVYSHRIASNNYVYHGVGLGHPLGPDADGIFVTLTVRPSPRTSIEIRSAFERHGEGHIGLPWSHELGRDGMFLSGVVERRSKLGLLFTQELSRNILLRTSLELVRSENHGNTQGSGWRGWAASVGLGLAP